MACVCERKSQNSEGAKKALAENQGSEEECLAAALGISPHDFLNVLPVRWQVPRRVEPPTTAWQGDERTRRGMTALIFSIRYVGNILDLATQV